MTFSSSTEDLHEVPVRWKKWLPIFLLTLLLHFLIFQVKVLWSPTALPPPIEIQEFDPKKLEAVRRQWKEKSLLIDPNPKTESAKEPPPDARYFSDRNIRVPKEQRALETHTIPKPAPGSSASQTQQEKPQEKPSSLAKLGVPFHFTPKPSKSEAEGNRDSQQGGQQAINDKNLPVGSENLLNASESVYYSFYARIYDTIAPIWYSKGQDAFRRNVPTQAGRDYITVVEITLTKDGNLAGIRTLQSSGIYELDQVVYDSFRQAGRFQNPPQGILDSRSEAHLTWSFRVMVPEGGFRLMPPQRVN